MLHSMLRRLHAGEIESDLAPFSTNRTGSASLESDASEMSILMQDQDVANAQPDTISLDLDFNLNNPSDSNLIDFDLNGFASNKKSVE